MRISGPGNLPTATTVFLRITALLLLVTCSAGRAEELDTPAPTRRSDVLEAIKPDAYFLQIGVADEVTAATAGAVWAVKVDSLSQRWGVFLEASASRWQSRGGRPSESGTLTQIALIPALRYWFGQGPSWFVEGGIGATLTSRIYRSSDTHFSTKFNFGDHLSLGYAFGSARKDEVALRAEHFSNAGIKEPNPGKNFLELRYLHRFE